jgi:hypothetical protein
MDKIVIEILEKDFKYNPEKFTESELMLIISTIEATKKALKKDKFDFKQALLDYGFLPNLVDDWLAVRRTKKATNTQTAYNNFIKELESRCHNKNETIELIVTQSWSGFKWKWVDNLNLQNNVGKQRVGTKAGEQHPLQNILDLSNRVLQDPRS